MNILCSLKNYQTESAEMNKFGENGLKKMNQKIFQFLIMKKRLMLIKILVTLFIYV